MGEDPDILKTVEKKISAQSGNVDVGTVAQATNTPVIEKTAVGVTTTVSDINNPQDQIKPEDQDTTAQVLPHEAPEELDPRPDSDADEPGSLAPPVEPDVGDPPVIYGAREPDPMPDVPMDHEPEEVTAVNADPAQTDPEGEPEVEPEDPLKKELMKRLKEPLKVNKATEESVVDPAAIGPASQEAPAGHNVDPEPDDKAAPPNYIIVTVPDYKQAVDDLNKGGVEAHIGDECQALIREKDLNAAKDILDKNGHEATLGNHQDDESIFIRPDRQGALHDALHVAQGERIPDDKLLDAKNSSDPKLRKMANFALNARKWHHGRKASESYGEIYFGLSLESLIDIVFNIERTDEDMLSQGMAHATLSGVMHHGEYQKMDIYSKMHGDHHVSTIFVHRNKIHAMHHDMKSGDTDHLDSTDPKVVGDWFAKKAHEIFGDKKLTKESEETPVVSEEATQEALVEYNNKEAHAEEIKKHWPDAKEVAGPSDDMVQYVLPNGSVVGHWDKKFNKGKVKSYESQEEPTQEAVGVDPDKYYLVNSNGEPVEGPFDSADHAANANKENSALTVKKGSDIVGGSQSDVNVAASGLKGKSEPSDMMGMAPRAGSGPSGSPVFNSQEEPVHDMTMTFEEVGVGDKVKILNPEKYNGYKYGHVTGFGIDHSQQGTGGNADHAFAGSKVTHLVASVGKTPYHSSFAEAPKMNIQHGDWEPYDGNPLSTKESEEEVPDMTMPSHESLKSTVRNPEARKKAIESALNATAAMNLTGESQGGEIPVPASVLAMPKATAVQKVARLRAAIDSVQDATDRRELQSNFDSADQNVHDTYVDNEKSVPENSLQDEEYCNGILNGIESTEAFNGYGGERKYARFFTKVGY